MAALAIPDQSCVLATYSCNFLDPGRRSDTTTGMCAGQGSEEYRLFFFAMVNIRSGRSVIFLGEYFFFTRRNWKMEADSTGSASARGIKPDPTAMLLPSVAAPSSAQCSLSSNPPSSCLSSRPARSLGLRPAQSPMGDATRAPSLAATACRVYVPSYLAWMVVILTRQDVFSPPACNSKSTMAFLMVSSVDYSVNSTSATFLAWPRSIREISASAVLIR